MSETQGESDRASDSDSPLSAGKSSPSPYPRRTTEIGARKSASDAEAQVYKRVSPHSLSRPSPLSDTHSRRESQWGRPVQIIEQNADCHVVLGGDFSVDFDRDWLHTILLKNFNV